jgi:hypothetical protein
MRILLVEKTRQRPATKQYSDESLVGESEPYSQSTRHPTGVQPDDEMVYKIGITVIIKLALTLWRGWLEDYDATSFHFHPNFMSFSSCLFDLFSSKTPQRRAMRNGR